MFKKIGPHVFETDLADEGTFERNLVVTVGPRGLSLRGKGTPRTLGISWATIAKEAARFSGEIPGGYHSRPLEWLLRK